MKNFSKNLGITRFLIPCPNESETILPEYSREMISGNMSRSRSLRRFSSMIDLSPKFKVPSDPARGFINISDGVERREREECEAGMEVPPLRVSQWRWDHAIAFLPFLAASPHSRRRSHSFDETPFYDNHPRDFLGKVPFADAIALHWVRVITPSKASR